MKRLTPCLCFLACLLVPLCGMAGGAEKPKVRAVTAFVRLDRAHYEEQVREALVMLRQAEAAFERGGYDVQSIRITTQPFPEYTRGLSTPETLAFFRAYDTLATKETFDANIGPAMLQDSDDPAQAERLGEILAGTESLEGSLLIAGEDGIQWKSVQAAARLIKFVEEHSPHSQGNFRFAATAMLAPYAPFYPGSYHVGPGRRFSVGLQAANVVEGVFRETGKELATQRLTKALGDHARAIDKIALEIEKQSGWIYMGLDATPAPLREVSIARAIEKFSGGRFGSSGTMTAVGVITRAVSSLGVKQVGYSGLMLPVLEDSLLAQRWDEGAYGIDSLLAYSAVCGTGLDTIPLPGDVSAEQLERILGDVATLAVKWQKPLSARLLPVFNRKAGQRTEFDDPFLVNATIHPAP
jgi:uncharacterized protein (UPF0210 family)